MPKCDRCGSTENVQRSLVVDMPAVCLKCLREERELYYLAHEFTMGERAGDRMNQ